MSCKITEFVRDDHVTFDTVISIGFNDYRHKTSTYYKPVVDVNSESEDDCIKSINHFYEYMLGKSSCGGNTVSEWGMITYKAAILLLDAGWPIKKLVDKFWQIFDVEESLL